MAIVLTMLGYSVILMLQEAGRKGSEFEESFWKCRDRKRRLPLLEQSWWRLLARTFWLGFDGLLSGARAHAPPQSLAGRVTAIGFGGFLWLMATSYGANLTNFLVTSSTTGTVNSIEAAVNQAIPICAHAGIFNVLKAMYPGIILVEVDSRINVFKAIEKGVCGGEVGRLNDLLTEQSKGRHCNLMPVGNVVMTQQMGMPVAIGDVGIALKYALLDVIEDGLLKELYAKYQPASVCSTAAPSTSGRLDLDDMAGAFLFACIVIMLGLVTWVLDLAYDRWGPKPRAQAAAALPAPRCVPETPSPVPDMVNSSVSSYEPYHPASIVLESEASPPPFKSALKTAKLVEPAAANDIANGGPSPSGKVASTAATLRVANQFNQAMEKPRERVRVRRRVPGERGERSERSGRNGRSDILPAPPSPA